MPKAVKKAKLLKPREVAERLGVQPRTVARYLREGTLQGVKMNNHSWRVEEAELERYIRESRITPG